MTTTKTFSLMVAERYAAAVMNDARKAKKAGRPTVVSFYVKKARRAIREGRRGEFTTMQLITL